MFLPGSKAWEHNVDHSPLSSVEVKNDWSFTSTTPVCLLSMDDDNCMFNVTNTVHQQREPCLIQRSNGVWFEISGVISQQGCWEFSHPCHVCGDDEKFYPPLGVRGCF